MQIVHHLKQIELLEIAPSGAFLVFGENCWAEKLFVNILQTFLSA